MRDDGRGGVNGRRRFGEMRRRDRLQGELLSKEALNLPYSPSISLHRALLHARIILCAPMSGGRGADMLPHAYEDAGAWTRQRAYATNMCMQTTKGKNDREEIHS